MRTVARDVFALVACAVAPVAAAYVPITEATKQWAIGPNQDTVQILVAVGQVTDTTDGWSMDSSGAVYRAGKAVHGVRGAYPSTELSPVVVRWGARIDTLPMTTFAAFCEPYLGHAGMFERSQSVYFGLTTDSSAIVMLLNGGQEMTCYSAIFFIDLENLTVESFVITLVDSYFLDGTHHLNRWEDARAKQAR